MVTMDYNRTTIDTINKLEELQNKYLEALLTLIETPKDTYAKNEILRINQEFRNLLSKTMIRYDDEIETCYQVVDGYDKLTEFERKVRLAKKEGVKYLGILEVKDDKKMMTIVINHENTFDKIIQEYIENYNEHMESIENSYVRTYCLGNDLKEVEGYLKAYK